MMITCSCLIYVSSSRMAAFTSSPLPALISFMGIAERNFRSRACSLGWDDPRSKSEPAYHTRVSAGILTEPAPGYVGVSVRYAL